MTTLKENPNMIEITGVDLVKFAQKVYDLSVAQGMGFLHYTKDPLTEEEAKQYIWEDDGFMVLQMDYVKGRSCKMGVWRENSRLYIRRNWYDHTDYQLKELLKTFNLHDKVL